MSLPHIPEILSYSLSYICVDRVGLHFCAWLFFVSPIKRAYLLQYCATNVSLEERLQG